MKISLKEDDGFPVLEFQEKVGWMIFKENEAYFKQKYL